MAEADAIESELKGATRVILRGRVFISEETYAKLARFVAKAPPSSCHLEATCHDDNTMSYSCKGTCPSGTSCSLGFRKDIDEITYWCECKPFAPPR